jgi:hypothetical protein
MTQEPDKARRLGRIGLATRLAMCDFTIPLTPEEKAEQALWENLAPVGREFGSAEWIAEEERAEREAAKDNLK